jgi:cystathionine gamma-synthase
MKLSTQLIHAGNVKHDSGAVMSPIILSTTFEREDDQLGYRNGYLYSRYDTPNRTALETKLALMENGATCVSFASGLSASLAVFQSLQSGDHVILPDDAYFGVKNILHKLFPQFGLTYSMVDMLKMSNIEAAIQPNTKLIWLESPSNPRVKVTDIAAVVALAKKYNCFTVADNTWATPYFTQPLALGVDISLHSTTKYLGGHSDILGGALIFKETDARYEFIRVFQKTGGAVPSPFDCWLLCRSLATFMARMPIHAKSAMKLATYLHKHPAIETVLYPGLPSDPQHEIAKKQMIGGFGGMLSILVKGGQEAALKVCANLKIFCHATSLGGVESLIEHRRSVEGVDSPSPENLLRISVGIEDVDDLIADFEQALKAITPLSKKAIKKG